MPSIRERMKNLLVVALAAFAAPVFLVSPALAQSHEAGIAASAHGELIDVIVGDNRVAGLQTASRLVAEQTISANPILVEIALEDPAFRQELAEAMLAPLARQNDRLFDEYRPQYIAALRSAFSDEEAAELATFFASPVAQALIGRTVANTSIDAAMKDLDAGEQISEQSVRANIAIAGGRALDETSQAELETLHDIAAKNPRLLENVGKLGPIFLPIRTAMENEPLTSDEEALFIQALAEVYARYGLEIAS